MFYLPAFLRPFAFRAVTPEIKSVHIAVVQPVANLMAVVIAFSLARLKGKSAGNLGASRRNDRIKYRFKNIVGPLVGGEQFSIDHNVDSFLGLMLLKRYFGL